MKKCPLLSIALGTRTQICHNPDGTTNIDRPISCIGEECAWWVNIGDESEKNGCCALAFIALKR